jgi:hypothetical protein
MRVCWKSTPIMGMFHNRSAGIQTGEIVDIDPIHARRYVEAGLAVPADEDGAHF